MNGKIIDEQGKRNDIDKSVCQTNEELNSKKIKNLA
jgi:hypothetical protein